jgi:uncharacterized protein with ParB-like and HNH nuclease domain
MKLIAFLGNDKENLGQVTALINRGEWEESILIKEKTALRIAATKKYKTIDVDTSKDLLTLKSLIQDKLKKELSNDLELALSIASGSGKEHMALISALLSIPVGIKLVAFTKKGIEFL